eukprot:6179536-Pleurochrysis_carterae.AAC.2
MYGIGACVRAAPVFCTATFVRWTGTRRSERSLRARFSRTRSHIRARLERKSNNTIVQVRALLHVLESKVAKKAVGTRLGTKQHAASHRCFLAYGPGASRLLAW